jgi:Fe-S-cluster containining protein
MGQPATLKRFKRGLRDAKGARAKFVKTWAARAARANSEHKVTCCGRGCHGCCYQLALASIWEGALIAHYLLQTNQLGVMQAVERQGNEALELIGDEYKPDFINAATAPWLDARKPCCFLRDGACVIYALRPIACSSYLVCSDPHICYQSSGAEVATLNNSGPLAWGLTVDQQLVGDLLGLKAGTFVTLPLPLGRAVGLAGQLLLEGPKVLRALEVCIGPWRGR